MKNPPLTLVRYWARCQQGLPVCCSTSASGRLHLKLGSSTELNGDAPLLYVRLNQPTGRLLIHFIQTKTLKPLAFLQNGMLRIPEGSNISASLAHQLLLPEGHYSLRAGEYPLLADERFLTASVQLVRAQQPASQAANDEPSQTPYASW